MVEGEETGIERVSVCLSDVLNSVWLVWDDRLTEHYVSLISIVPWEVNNFIALHVCYGIAIKHSTRLEFTRKKFSCYAKRGTFLASSNSS